MTNQQNAGMTAMADLVLNPAAHWSSAGVYTPAGVAQVDAVNTAWQQYRLDTSPQVQYTTSGGPQNYTVDVAPEPNDPASLNYSDGYFAAADADALWDAFSRIIDSITSTAKGPTEVGGRRPGPQRLHPVQRRHRPVYAGGYHQDHSVGGHLV